MKQFTISYSRLAALLALLLVGLQSACTYKKVNTDPKPVVPCLNTPTAATVSYQRDVWPILKNNCRDACHNPQSAASYANFNMDVFAQVQYYSTTKPSSSAPYSWLVGNIRHEPNQGYVYMPVGASKLSDCDIATIEAWVAAGTPNN